MVHAFALLGLAAASILFLPVLGPWNDALTAPWASPEGDTLIVLAAEEVADGLLGLHSYWRSAYAVYEWRQGKYSRIIMSGKGLAKPMHDFAVAHGVPASAILLEEKSSTTREQGIQVAALLGNIPAGQRGRIVILTSDFHSRRALRVFQKLGIPAVAHPVPDAGKRLLSWQGRWEVFLDLALESIKTAVYQWRGWI